MHFENDYRQSSLRRALAHRAGLTGLAAFALIVGVCVSVSSSYTDAFQRSGAIVTAIGLILISRDKIIGKDLLIPVLMGDDSPYCSNDARYYEHIGEPVPSAVEEDEESRISIGIYGPLISILGTLVWGFGDLPFK